MFSFLDHLPWWLKAAILYFIIQLPFSLYLFNFAWNNSKQFRQKKDKKLHAKFPMFARQDDPASWTYLSFLPGVLFLLTARFLTSFTVLLVGCLLLQLLCLGHDFEKGPLMGWRRSVKRVIAVIVCRTIVFLTGMRVNIV